MSKTIVVHIFPDLDAIAAAWLLVRFDSQFEDSQFEFVPAGKTLNGKIVDSDPSVVHVDTGMGRFDHHQTGERTCAAKKVLDYLFEESLIGSKNRMALKRLVEIVIQVDHFEDFFWDKPDNDRYDFFLKSIFDYLKMSGKLNDRELMVQGFLLLDAVLFGLKEKVKAEDELTKGVEFESRWGKSIGVETQFSRVSKLAQKKGYTLIVRKEEKSGMVSVKCQPRPELDLTKAYEALRKADPQADWFFHSSKHIIVNGSRHNPEMKPSNLSLDQVIGVLSNVK